MTTINVYDNNTLTFRLADFNRSGGTIMGRLADGVMTMAARLRPKHEGLKDGLEFSEFIDFVVGGELRAGMSSDEIAAAWYLEGVSETLGMTIRALLAGAQNPDREADAALDQDES